jgi:hypothetical protein
MVTTLPPDWMQLFDFGFTEGSGEDEQVIFLT